jgi:uncharacterized coiled-coil protein SlyX
MKKRGYLTIQNDPLELMLDTLSNVFGGIILISCLLALLPRNESRISITVENQARGEMIERRLITAREQLAAAEASIKGLSKKEDAGQSALDLKRRKLEALVEKMRAETKVIDDAELSKAELEALAKSGDPEVLGKELERLRRIAIEQEGISKSILDKNEFLTGRLDNLSKEIENLKEGITQQLRFPRERGGGKDPYPIIVWDGAVYPLLTGNDLSPNPAVEMEEVTSDEAYRAKPIKGMGCVSPLDDKKFIEGIKAAKKEGGYISIYLYPDSHSVFRELKEALFKEGIAYGIEFVPAFRVLAFGSDGTMPPEL